MRRVKPIFGKCRNFEGKKHTCNTDNDRLNSEEDSGSNPLNGEQIERSNSNVKQRRNSKQQKLDDPINLNFGQCNDILISFETINTQTN